MRRLLIGFATLALLMAFPSPLVTPVALAATDVGSCATFSQTTPGEYTCTVPAGVTELTFEVRAANGGRGAGLSTPTPGGQGAKITGSLTVTPSEMLYITVGSTGYGYDGINGIYKNNGGGGGYSSVAHLVSDVLTPLVVAGGGGGAGTADQTYGTTSGAGGAGGNGGTTVTTRGGGAGGNGGATGTSATAGQDGGTTSVGGAGGSLYGGAGGDLGVTGTWQSTASWTVGNARPGAGGGGFGAYGGYANPTYWVPAGSARSVAYGGHGAGGEGSSDGGGGGGGGYAGGGGGGANATITYATGGGGGGSSYVPEGATALIEAGSPHVTLSGAAPTAPVNDNVANAVALTGTSGSVAGTTVNATLQTLEEAHFRGSTSNSVWYEWTGSSRKDLVVTFSGGDCNTFLEVSDLAPGGPPEWTDNTVAWSTEPCVGQSTMKFFATAGRSYWIRLSVAASGTAGEFTLSWTTASPVRGSLAITLTNTRKDPTTCTMTVKGVNLLPGEWFAVRAIDVATEESVESQEFSTVEGRWVPAPVTVPRTYFSATATGYGVFASTDYVDAADGVTDVPLSIMNRCGL